ncbi:MAG: hypothetical protein ACXVP0_16475, partial [Bacteroidia bacterium]
KHNSNGWVEYVITSLSDFNMVGYLDSASSLQGVWTDIDHGLYQYNNTLYFLIGGALYYSSNGYQLGDVIRIEKKDTLISYQVNGYEFLQDIIPSAERSRDFKLKTILFGQPVVNIGASFYDSTGIAFPGYLRDYPAIDGLSGVGSDDGSIGLSPLPSAEAHTYTWSPGSYTTAIISDRPAGNYTATAADAAGNTSPERYDIGYKIYWTDTTNIILSHDTLFASATWGTAVSVDTLQYNEDGWIQYVIDTTSAYRMIGFLDSAYADGDYIDIDYGVFQNGSHLYVLSGGTVSLLTPLSYGDIIKIKRTDTIVEVLVNEYSFGIYGTMVIPSTARSKGLWAKTVILPGSYFARAIWTPPPAFNTFKVYAVLKRNLDGDYYTTKNNTLLFTVDGIYNSMTSLNYKVYDYKRALQSVSITSPVTALNTGDNRYALDISSLGAGYYVLEVENQKKEKLMLRFKK